MWLASCLSLSNILWQVAGRRCTTEFTTGPCKVSFTTLVKWMRPPCEMLHQPCPPCEMTFCYVFYQKLFEINWFKRVWTHPEPGLDAGFSSGRVQSKVQPRTLNWTYVQFCIHKISCWTGLNWTSAALGCHHCWLVYMPHHQHLAYSGLNNEMRLVHVLGVVASFEIVLRM